MTTTNVIRFSALGFGVFVGLTHQLSLNSAAREHAAQKEVERKQNLIDRAKADYVKKTTSQEGKVISNPEDPNFDFEAWAKAAEAGKI